MDAAKKEYVCVHSCWHFGMSTSNLAHKSFSESDIFPTQFAIGWWAVIDACAEYSEPRTAAYHICGIFSTIALFM